MASLHDQLILRTPLVWVSTSEPAGIIHQVCATVKDRTVYRLDALDGLVSWSPKRDDWLRVLVPTPEGEGPTRDFQVALSHLMANGGVFLADNAHLSAEALANLYHAIALRHHQALHEDNLNRVPPQFILLSHSDELPRELGEICVHVNDDPPDSQTLARLSEHLQTASTRPATGDAQALLRAAGGLSEAEYVRTALVSLRRHGHIDAEEVSKRKIEVLKNTSSLEIRQPNLTIHDLGGLDRAKELLRQVHWLWHNPDQAKEFDADPLRRILIVGVSGSGKSALAEAAASMLGLELAKGGVSNAMSKWVGESEKNMRQMFAALKAMAPVVFWIDEFGRDMSGGQSSGAVDGGTTDRVHGEFLTGVQELPSNVFLVGAANRIESLPPEITRSDRFDRVMFVGFPTQEERKEIFSIHLGERAGEYNLDDLASATEMFTGAEIKALVRTTRSTIAASEQRMATTQDLIAAAPRHKGRVWVNHQSEIIAMYKRAMAEWDWASSAQEREASVILNAARTTQTNHKPKALSMK